MVRMKKVLLLSSTVLIGGVLFWLVENSRAATPTPDYQVVRAEGSFEVRDYPEMKVATTAMDAGGMDDGFGKLFRFITGANEEKAKIAMTTSVLIDRTPEKETMSFILPKDALEKGVPTPVGGAVRLGKVERARFAVLRFSGGRTDGNEKEALAKLREWMKAQKLAARREPVFAYYDPSWTPPFLRRNEALRRVEPSPK